ncbi:hypothetical protein GOBAR_AA16463 [Gossypium barbadense]|uniref:Reticulon domain-containing protein n=1 Tax=Gossypium barbadense TaxID=3634 RepID=A0A2P5XLK9_GOSBA|nr:hypothetical protein GOBAR_AA16463 [Gossypium barbadense]
MDLSFRRGEAKGSVVAGSVWETRMKSDEVKDGIKVFNAGTITEENSNGVGGTKRLSLKKGQPVVGGVGKRKTWKNESFEGLEKDPIQIAKGNAEEKCKELSVSVGGISKRSHQIRVAKGRSLEHCKDLSLSFDGIKSPVQVKKGRSEGMRELSKSVDGIERSPIHMKKPRSEVPKRSKDVNEGGERMEGNSVQLRKSKSEQSAGNGNGNEANQKVLVLDDQNKGNNVPIDEDEEKNGSESEEKCKEFEKKLADERKKLPEEKPGKAEVNKLQEDKPNKVVNEVKKISQFHNKTSPFSSTLNKQLPPVVKHAASVYTTPTKPTISDDYHYQRFPQSQNKLQNLVDLVMWRDVSKSALVFGMGTFIIISSSYTQDLNISFISAMSYVCLVYLAAIFLYRSIICRGVMDVDELSYVVGEEEAFWLLKLVLPYLNEFLIKLKALFSGDPATTMKLAVLLLVLARCGSSITIWKMTKLKFWIRRFRDAWESCTHKNAVAMAIFTLVWNQCSFVGRVWAAFMLFVALRYYQQKMVTDEWVEDEDGPSCQQTCEGPIGKQTHGLAP